ncbi:hypothetical protein [Bifidobacterium parmae]|uniref:Uridine kinase n=1 Tax=Bifidobacterium parmae TaxID=361854 RepID=A0A2N5IWS7_9BIFI|nr:hypothetical protein [Bifidobacterium parmae]PLS26401.1 uridine kinase [Bifidobacterium parmae]
MDNPRRRITRGTAILATVVCLLATAACSAGATTDAGQSNDTTAGIDDKTKAENTRLETIAKRFAACLTDKGFDARTVESYASATVGMKTKDIPRTTVVLRRIDQAGNSTTAGNSDGIDTLYPNVELHATIDDAPWVGFAGSDDLAGTPYADRQQDYAACEQANPDFSQPPLAKQARSDPGAQLAMLEFARKARADGFDWYPDPDPAGGGTTGSVNIPDTVSAEEFRRFLTTYYTSGNWPSYNGIPFGMSLPGDRADLDEVQREIIPDYDSSRHGLDDTQ